MGGWTDTDRLPKRAEDEEHHECRSLCDEGFRKVELKENEMRGGLVLSTVDQVLFQVQIHFSRNGQQ